jgi:hypothetical protein
MKHSGLFLLVLGAGCGGTTGSSGSDGGGTADAGGDPRAPPKRALQDPSSLVVAGNFVFWGCNTGVSSEVGCRLRRLVAPR